MLLAHKIALDPNAAQRNHFARAAGTSRFAFNWALGEWRKQYQAGGKPSEVSLRRQLNTLKRSEYPWMYDVSKCVVQEAIIDLGTAFRAFFEKRGRYPRFKRKDGRASFCAANETGTFRTDGERIKLPVIGWVRMREEVRFSGPLKRATISLEGGRWFVSVMVETDDVQPVQQPEAAVGVDLGISALATLSKRGRRWPKGAQGSPQAPAAHQQGAGPQTTRLSQLSEGQATAGRAACPHRQRPPRRHA
jgi:putative transposase